MQEAWRQANLAQTNLSQLPVPDEIVETTTKFLNQVGDMAYALNNQNMEGKNLTDEQYKTVEQLHGYASSLSDSLNDLQASLSQGRLVWKELERKAPSFFQRTSSELPQQQFENIDKTFQEYPTLIYDGPFSEHLVSIEPRGITGDNISVEDARTKVVRFFGEENIKAVNDTGTDNESPIKTYSFSVDFKDQTHSANMSLTQKGGHVIWMLHERPIGQETIDMNKAKEIGRLFLESKGYKNMVDTYYLKEDGTATINYAYKQDNVTVYSDLIKVKVALDNGEITGFESKTYLSAHIVRNIPKPKITEAQARSKVSAKMDIQKTGLAIIPTNYKTEIFTYEFKGKLFGKDFLVYINAETGKEENILMIIDTPNGILTM
jgi:germination protein YpeB